MSYQVAVLVCLLLAVSTTISAIFTVACASVGIKEVEPKLVGAAIGLLFLTVILSWGIWAVLPLTHI